MGLLQVKEDQPRQSTLRVKTDTPEARPERIDAVGTREASGWTGEKPRRKSHMGKAVDIHRMPPHSIDAEQGVLGSILISKGAIIPNVQAQLPTTHYFYVPAHATIYQALLDHWDSGDALDLITFTQFLRDRNLLDEVGGAAFVTSLFTFVPTAGNVDYYIDIVREKFLRREMIHTGTQTVQSAYCAQGDEVAGILDNFARKIERIKLAAEPDMFFDASHMLNGEMPQLPKVIIHHILHQGSKMILGGTSKSNKTWALMDLALSICTGEDWWGFHTNKARVCYVNLELQEGFFAQRLKSICDARSIFPEEGSLKILNLRGHAESIEALRKRFAMFLRAGYFGAVVLDPLYKVLGRRDENKAGDVATLLNEIEGIAVETGAAVVFAAHYSKGNQAQKESMDRIGGSGVLARDPDSILTMTQHETPDCFTVDGTLRNLSPIRSFVVHWNYPLFTREEDHDPQKLKGKGGRPSNWSAGDILDEMSIIQGVKVTDLEERCLKELGMPKTTFYRYWTMLKREKKVKVDDERLYTKTDGSETA